MASLNRIVIIGQLLSDPESRFTVEGLPVAKFGISVNGGFNQPAGTIDVVSFRQLAETCGQVLKKNSQVLVEGKIQVRSYQDQPGNRKWVTEIIATSVQPMSASSAPTEKSPSAPQAVYDSNGFEEVEALPEDDLPF